MTGSRAAAGSVESGVDRYAAPHRTQTVAAEVADADRVADGELEAGVVLETGGDLPVVTSIPTDSDTHRAYL